jgi:hypothetical protein
MEQGLRQKSMSSENVSIFNISFDVKFDQQGLQNLANQWQKSGIAVTAREDSDNVPLPKTDEVTELLRLSYEPTEKDSPGVLINQNIIALARNTATIVPLSEITRLEGYNNEYNESGGMEDHDFIVRLILDFLKKGKFGVVKRILRACNNPAYYQDTRWDALTSESRDEKKNRELGAIKTIAENIIRLHGEGASEENEYVTPEQNRDFRFS